MSGAKASLADIGAALPADPGSLPGLTPAGAATVVAAVASPPAAAASQPGHVQRAWPTQADLGGRAFRDAVQPEPEGELWHAPWEPRALALTLAAGGMGEWNIDMSRAARETLPAYLRLSYYEIWIHALCQLLAERGLVGADELEAKQALRPARPVNRVLSRNAVPAALRAGSPTLRPAATPPRFAVGQHVRTSEQPSAHHTRLPGYARGKVGVVQGVHGCHVFADAHAQGLGEQPQWLYSVAFSGAELWGGDGPDGDEACRLKVSIDAWETYLHPVAEADARAASQMNEDALSNPASGVATGSDHGR